MYVAIKLIEGVDISREAYYSPSDCDKNAIYRNTFTASYVFYPEDGNIKRFHGYVGKWIPRYCVIVCNKPLMSIY